MALIDFLFRRLERLEKRLASDRPTAQPGPAAKKAEQLVAEANALADRNLLDQAAQKLTLAINFSSNFAPAHLSLGNVQLAQGNAEAAFASYTTALSLKPDDAAANYNLGNVHVHFRRFPEALVCYQQALRIRPDFLDAVIALGNTQDDLELFDDAVASYRRALHLNPNFMPIRGNLSNVLLKLGQIDLAAGNMSMAMDRFTMAATTMPGNAQAHYLVGYVHAGLGQHHLSLDAHRKALALQPDFVEAQVALANAQFALEMLEDAAQSYRRAADLQPDNAAVHGLLARTLLGLGRIDEAEQSCRRAVECAPTSAEAHCNLGTILEAQRNWTQALDAFRRAMAIDPDNGAATYGAFVCAGNLCDWSHRRTDRLALERLIALGATGIRPFGLLSMEAEGSSAALLQRQVGLQYAQSTLGFPKLADRDLQTARHPDDARLRIGYLSADVHEHATMHLLGGVLAAHDRSRFKIHLYSYGTVADAVTEKARQICEVFRDVSQRSDDEAARQIVSDAIDVLVDLKGYTKDTRLGISASRPAPSVVSWLGYPGTLGHPDLADYIIGDPIVSPLENAAHFSETLALLPHCYQPNDRARNVGPETSRAAFGLPQDSFVFCSFNQNFKFNPQSLDAWCQVLANVPDSVLWLLSISQEGESNLRREVELRGISAARLRFAEPVPPAQHLARLKLADLVLDTFPYNSHTTASDALWVGVPLVTHMGEAFASRVASSLLHAVGLPELVTANWDDYVALAISLALDPQRLTALRDRLVQQRLTTPLFDTSRFTRNLERLFACIAEQRAQGRKEAFVVQDTDC